VDNAGFMITAGDKKVLIDVLLEGYLMGTYAPQETMQRVANAAAPFDQVDLILATHAHPDHFSAELVSRHLRNNPEAVFVSTREAASQIRGAGDDLAARIIPISLETGESQRLTVNDIELECLHLTHGDDSILNLGFLIAIEGVTFFHVGDMNVDSSIGDYVSLADLIDYGLPQKEIDFAFLQSYMYALEDFQPIIFEGIGAKYTAPMHYPAAHPPVWIEEDFPDVIVFKATMDSWVMP
jgi:L-ascorbate metabolism protein UlaG (beta-lactamase superfamily)